MKLTAVTVTKTFFGDPKRSFVPDEKNKKSLNGEEKSKTVITLTNFKRDLGQML
jgi:hypothetical protein